MPFMPIILKNSSVNTLQAKSNSLIIYYYKTLGNNLVSEC
jgi:hypothetical protein